MLKIHTTSRAGLRAALIAGGAAVLLTVAACGSDAAPAAPGGTSTTAESSMAMTSGSEAMTSGSEEMTSGSEEMTSGSEEMTSGSEEMTSGSEEMTSGSEEMTSGSAGASGSGAAQSSVAMTGPAPTALTDAEKAAAKKTLVDQSSLTVCTSLPYPPFEGDDGTGKVVGFDIDFMDLMSEQLGVTTKVVSIDFSGIKSGQAMSSKNCDIAAAAMTINPERQAVIEFSDPYYDASQALMVLADSPVVDLSGLSGKKLGAQTGTTGLAYANANAAEFGYSVVEYVNISDEEQALQTNAVDAAIHDQPALNDYLKQQDGAVKIVTNFNTGEQYGFGAAKGNTDLVAVANFVIAQAQSDGTYQASFTKWIDSGNG